MATPSLQHDYRNLKLVLTIIRNYYLKDTDQSSRDLLHQRK